MEQCARGGLEPHFRVLFSAIFHGVSLGDFHQGRNQKGGKGQSTILDRFGARSTRLAWPLGWKSLGRDRRTDARSRWRGNQTHAPPARTKNGETCCEGYQPLCREVQVTGIG